MPIRLLGNRKVIERHVGGAEARDLAQHGIAFAIAPSPSVVDGVAALRTVLAGASNQADLNPTEAWSQAQQQLSARLGTNVRFANSWEDWAQLVGAAATDVLLVLPHVAREAGRTFLEIGGDESLEIVHDLGFYVGDRSAWAAGMARAPLVLLLGCGTAAGAAPLEEFTGKFLDAGARAVIGTIAVVRGRFVAPLAVELVSMVLQQNTSSIRLGELLRDLRREGIARGEPTALCLIAFGDADWLIKGV